MTGKEESRERSPRHVDRGEECPKCGQEIIRAEKCWLPVVAFKKEMYDVCFFDADELPKGYRGKTVIAYHEEIEL